MATLFAPAAGPEIPSEGGRWGPVHDAVVAAGYQIAVLAGRVDIAELPVAVVGDACAHSVTRLRGPWSSDDSRAVGSKGSKVSAICQWLWWTTLRRGPNHVLVEER